jgi:hypothetical protein
VYSKRVLYLISAILLGEAIAVLALHSRLPMPVRVLAAAINMLAVAVLLLLARQRPS